MHFPPPGAQFDTLPVQFQQKSESAQPRAVVRLWPGGVGPYTFNVKSFTIDKNCHGATNTASFVVPIKNNPDWTKLLLRGDGALVPDDTPIYVEILAGFPGNPGPNPSTAGLVRRFYGIVDLYTPDNLNTTEFHCRSVAAPLCTDRVTSALQNVTTVQLIRRFGAEYNIPVKVDPKLTNPYTLAMVYQQDQVVGLKQVIKWDILLRSALCDDVDVWEDDGTLNYYYAWDVVRKTLNLQYGTNVKDLKGTHSPQFNRNIEVFVHSGTPRVRTGTTVRVKTHTGTDGSGVDVTTNTKVSTRVPVWGTNEATTTTYYSNGTVSVTTGSVSGGPSSGSTTAISESGREKYYITRNNLTAQQCEDYAKKIWRQISMHEYQIDAVIAMTPEFLPSVGITSLLDVTGYPFQRFNTTYWPRSYHETFDGPEPGSDTAGGWTVAFHAVSHQPPVGGI